MRYIGHLTTLVCVLSLLSFTTAQLHGFIIKGNTTATADIGWSVSSGDVNGDGIDDILLGYPNGTFRGQSYVIYGRKSSTAFPSQFNLSSLDGSNGFTIDAAIPTRSLGYSVSLEGDVNGDNFDDILLGCENSNNNQLTEIAYVIFGKKTFNAHFNLSDLNGTNGFTLATRYGYVGSSVSHAGDLNGDQYDDMLIGTPTSRQAYLIFGAAVYPSLIDTLNGTTGFLIVGYNDYLGVSVSIRGDVNGDSFDDIILGAPDAAPEYGGQAIIFYGTNTSKFLPSYTPVYLNSSVCSKISGFSPHDHLGQSVSSGGDFNGDKIDDILIGANHHDSNNISDSGQSYVIFGKQGPLFPVPFNVSDLSGTDGFMINGISSTSYSGFLVSFGGDVNGDGFDDILIGSHHETKNETFRHIIFGTNTPFQSTFNLTSLDGYNGFTIGGISHSYKNPRAFSTVAKDVNGDKIADIVIGAVNYPDLNQLGVSYVIFGRNSSISPFTPMVDASNMNNFIQRTIPFQNQTLGQNKFSFSINGTDLITDIGLPAIYSFNTSPNLSSLKFSSSDFTFDGAPTENGIFKVSVVANNYNGIVTGEFYLTIESSDGDASTGASVDGTLGRVALLVVTMALVLIVGLID